MLKSNWRNYCPDAESQNWDEVQKMLRDIECFVDPRLEETQRGQRDLDWIHPFRLIDISMPESGNNFDSNTAMCNKTSLKILWSKAYEMLPSDCLPRYLASAVSAVVIHNTKT